MPIKEIMLQGGPADGRKIVISEEVASLKISKAPLDVKSDVVEYRFNGHWTRDGLEIWTPQ